MSVELQSTTSDNNYFTAVSLTDADSPSGAVENKDVETATVTQASPDSDPIKNENFVLAYVNKLKGCDGKSPDRSPITEILYTSVLGFIGILLVSVIGFWYLGKEFHGKHGTAINFMTGAYAATSVLVYDQKLIKVPVAQPRNVIGGYVVSSFTGVVVRIICGYVGLERWTTGAFAVMFALITMSATKTLHPPAGAVALISVIGGPGIWDMGFGYVLTSAGGSFVMVMVAWLGNNLMPGRQYPAYWW